MRLATDLLRFGLAAAAFAVGTQPASAQTSIEPIVGWTWEGQYNNWQKSGPNGHIKVAVDLAPALTLGARLSVLVRSTRFAISYARSRPDLTVVYDALTTGENFSFATFDRVSSQATNQKLALEFAYAGGELPLSLELGGSLLVRGLSVSEERPEKGSGSRTYENLGASLRVSIKPYSERWGVPRVALEAGAISGSSDVGLDVLSIFTVAHPASQWTPFVGLTASWRVGL